MLSNRYYSYRFSVDIDDIDSNLQTEGCRHLI